MKLRSVSLKTETLGNSTGHAYFLCLSIKSYRIFSINCKPVSFLLDQNSKSSRKGESNKRFDGISHYSLLKKVTWFGNCVDDDFFLCDGCNMCNYFGKQKKL